jgi:uncharacterized protein
MPVYELKPNLKKSFLNFVRKYEYKSISFISRINRNGNLVIPSGKVAKIFCEISKENTNDILNVIMITAGGIILPLFSDIKPQNLIVNEMIKNILIYNKRIFCILGISEDTAIVKKSFNYSKYSIINYSLLLRENEKCLYSLEKSSLKIKKAKKKDAFLLYPLEKSYLLEEVLVGTNAINQQAALLNLRKTCSTQFVFYAVSEKKIIAKVNTNGKGLEYYQIGGVYTKPEYRNRGISTLLMKILLNEIQTSGKKTVLYVKNENKPALALYKKLGFRIADNYSAHYIQA